MGGASGLTFMWHWSWSHQKCSKKGTKLQDGDVDKDLLENYTSKGLGEHF
jgi:hypothetical protein